MFGRCDPDDAIAPPISPSTVTRRRITGWLERHAELPLRALIAPAGYGKTTEIVRYLQGLGSRYVYVRGRPEDHVDTLASRIATALGFEGVASFERLRVALASTACTIAVDALDLAGGEAIAAIGAFALGGPRGVRTIVAGCRAETVRAPRLFTQGLAATLGARDLAFVAEDVDALCESLGVDRSEGDVRALVQSSDGWPVVASNAVRAAAEAGRSLHAAYEMWLRENARMLAEFIEAERARSPDSAAAAFARALSGEPVLDDDWQAMESAGLFVIEAGDGGHRLLRPVADAHARRGGTAGPVPLHVTILGGFEVKFGAAAVHWMRRRDMEIVRLLALRPRGSASRAELMARFWPGAPRTAAQQSLRTACSYIRKAIAAVVGAGRVDRYFTAGDEVELHPGAISLDAQRFLAHVAQADEAYAAGRNAEGAAHDRAARRLHAGAPAIDASDPEQAAFAARVEEAFERVRTRLTALGEFGEGTDGSSGPRSSRAAKRAVS